MTRNIDTVTISAFNNPMNIFRASAPKVWNIIHTRVALSFDYKEKTANGQEWVVLQPYFYPTDSLVLDAKGMKIESVSVGHNDKPVKFTYDSLQLKIQLERTYTKEEQLKLSIKYVAMPYMQATGGSSAITDDRGLYFINTDNKVPGKPVQIWTQGETESNSHWLPTIDKPNMRTTLQLELTVPGQYKTLGNGALISSMEKGMMRTDIWKMDKPIQVYAIMFAIGEFVIAKDKWKDKEVNYYVEPAYGKYAKTMFQHTPEMIEFFSNVTGVPYPWNKYSQVVVRDYVSGAMENTSASLFGEFMNQDKREYADGNHEDVVSHELFHQWFGDYVTAESWSNLTVNESFATYGEYLWRKHKYGLSYADELAWSDLNRYLTYTDYAADPVLVRHHYRDKEEMFDRVSYQKGGAILHYLHHLVGDSAFYQSMKIYLTKNALQSAEATHWRLAVEEATGKDWNWFFNQWYYRAGHPELDIIYTYDDAGKKLTVTVMQVQNDNIGLYELPLKSVLLYGNEKVNVDWTLRKAKESFVYEYKNGVAPVVVPDVAHVLPGTIKEKKEYKHWQVQIEQCDDFVSKLLAVESIQNKDMEKMEVQAILSKALNNRTAAIRDAALDKLSLISSEPQRTKWKQEVVMLAKMDGNNTVRAAAIAILGKWKMKDQKQLLVESIEDSSYLVAGSALRALSLIDDSLSYELAKQNLNSRANTNLENVAWKIVMGKAKDADTIILKNYAIKREWMDKSKHFSADVATFSINTKHENAFRSSLEILASNLKETENKNARVNIASCLNGIYSDLKEKLAKDKKNTLLLKKYELLRETIKQLNAEEKEREVKEVYTEILK